MPQQDLARIRLMKHLARQDQEKASGAVGAPHLSDAGPPNWDRRAWEDFRATHGFYPFGMQNGSLVAPPTYDGAPDWVFELMGIRRPPVLVNPGADYWGG